GLKWLGACSCALEEAREELRSTQREDGGWAQLASMSASDAYATGLALFALHEGGGLTAADQTYQRGVRYLLESQRPDGTWFVRKWAHGYNTYFDAGFP